MIYILATMLCEVGSVDELQRDGETLTTDVQIR
jgi:hypothetical protein